uniref:Reverse transcriptase Ty1/copia-type domain-containing protein n=1 Tax=Amphimedon queenslandica TaxID=400682 RepID=A0A1X7SL12_AMPQE
MTVAVTSAESEGSFSTLKPILSIEEEIAEEFDYDTILDTSATQEAIWLRRLLSDLNVDIQDPTEIKEDNQGTIGMSKNPVGYKQAVIEGSICVTYCPTNDMLADIFTKPLPKSRFEKLRDGLGLGNY